jgi:acetylornithine deacetylase
MTKAAFLEQVWAHLDQEHLFDLVEEAVRRYTPSGAEQPAAELFAAALKAAGVPCERQPVGATGRENLLVVLGEEPVALLLVGHLDTIRLLPLEQLPAPRRAGDLLYGLGSADMKGGCAALVACLAALVASGLTLSRGVAVALVVGEEEYGDGSLRLFERLQAPLVVIGEPTGLVPCTGHHGYLELDLEVRGRRAHAALPELGASAIEPMLRWLLDIVEGAPRLGPGVVVNVRELEGGSALFVVPDHCEASLDVHLPAGLPLADFERLVEEARLRAAATAADGVALKHARVHWGRGYAPSGEPAYLDTLRRAFSLAGLPFAPGVFRSHSDASLVGGAYPVVCGPGRLEVAHARHEHVSLEEVWQAARLYVALVVEACL